MDVLLYTIPGLFAIVGLILDRYLSRRRDEETNRHLSEALREVSSRAMEALSHSDLSRHESNAVATRMLLEQLRDSQASSTHILAQQLRESQEESRVLRGETIELLVQLRRDRTTDEKARAALEVTPKSTADANDSMSDLLQILQRSVDAARVKDSEVQTVPVSVYTSGNATEGEKLAEAVLGLLNEYGFETDWQSEPLAGSWFQRFRVKLSRAASSDGVVDRLHKVEHALELEFMDKKRAEVDKAKAEAIATLLSAVNEQDDAIIRVGSVVVVKHGGKIFAETISEEAARVLESDSMILRSPSTAADFFLALHDRAPLPANNATSPPTMPLVEDD